MIRTDAINNLLTELNNEKAAVKQSQETRASLMTGERTSVQKQQAIVTNLIKEALPSIRNHYVSVELANGQLFGKLKNVTYENSSNVNVELVSAFLEGKIKLSDIYSIVSNFVKNAPKLTNKSIDDIFMLDKEIRIKTREYIDNIK